MEGDGGEVPPGEERAEEGGEEGRLGECEEDVSGVIQRLGIKTVK